eukprot:1611688-Pleurochrysis_carterae.AAC.2
MSTSGVYTYRKLFVTLACHPQTGCPFLQAHAAAGTTCMFFGIVVLFMSCNIKACFCYRSRCPGLLASFVTCIEIAGRRITVVARNNWQAYYSLLLSPAVRCNC